MTKWPWSKPNNWIIAFTRQLQTADMAFLGHQQSGQLVVPIPKFTLWIPSEVLHRWLQWFASATKEGSSAGASMYFCLFCGGQAGCWCSCSSSSKLSGSVCTKCGVELVDPAGDGPKLVAEAKGITISKQFKSRSKRSAFCVKEVFQSIPATG